MPNNLFVDPLPQTLCCRGQVRRLGAKRHAMPITPTPAQIRDDPQLWREARSRPKGRG